MAITIDWATKIITIPQSYLTLTSGIRYSLDIEKFRNDLKNIEDSEEGMVFPNTHARNAPTTLSGTVYAQTFEILSPYTVTFQNTGTPYVVIPNGANHNLGDVTNYDGGMSLVIGNSAGLQTFTYSTGGGVGTVAEVADAVWNAIAANYLTIGTTGAKLAAAGSAGDPWSTDLTTYNTAGTAGKYVKDNLAAITNIPSEVRTELTPELSHILQVPTASSGLTNAQATMLLEMYELLGLDPTKPLLVTQSARTAGTISQQIFTDTNQTLVQRV